MSEAAIHRFRVVVLHRLGLYSYPCVMIIKILKLYFPGLPVAVICDGEALIVRGVIELMMLAAGKGTILEFQVKGTKEEFLCFKERMLDLNCGNTSEPVFSEAQIEQASEDFDSILHERQPPVEKIVETKAETYDRLEAFRLHAWNLSNVICEIHQHFLPEDDIGWTTAEHWLGFLYEVTEDSRNDCIAALGIVTCVFRALETLESIPHVMLTGSKPQLLLVSDYLVERIPPTWTLPVSVNAMCALQDLLCQHTDFLDNHYSEGDQCFSLMNSFRDPNPIWQFYRRLSVAREYFSAFPYAMVSISPNAGCLQSRYY